MQVTTHDLSEMHALPVLALAEVHNTVSSFDAVAIDEAQFMPGMAAGPLSLTSS